MRVNDPGNGVIFGKSMDEPQRVRLQESVAGVQEEYIVAGAVRHGLVHRVIDAFVARNLDFDWTGASYSLWCAVHRHAVLHDILVVHAFLRPNALGSEQRIFAAIECYG